MKTQKMPTNKNILRFLLLLVAFSIGLFSGAVEALKCYSQGLDRKDDPERDNIKVTECKKDITGCRVALNCGDVTDVRGCAPRKDICEFKIFQGRTKTYNDICKHCEYCSDDLCNDKGLEKTGLKCIGKDAGSDVAFVEQCVTGQVGCVAAWDCKDTKATAYGCTVNKDFCKMTVPDFDGHQPVTDKCNCQYCTSDLCNEGGIKVKPILEGKSTKKTAEKPETIEKPESGKKPIQKNEKKPKPSSVEKPKPIGQNKPKSNSMEMEESTTPKTDGEKSNGAEATGAPSNGALGIFVWGQIGIIPICMMTLVLGAGLLKMLMI